MAKSSKKTKDAVSGAGSKSEPQDVVANRNANVAEPSVMPKVAAKAAKKRTGATTRKTGTSAKPRKTTSRKKPVPAENAVSDEDIRIRAYFLAEQRAGRGLPGDSSSDWLEARRQLLAEAAA